MRRHLSRHTCSWRTCCTQQAQAAAAQTSAAPARTTRPRWSSAAGPTRARCTACARSTRSWAGSGCVSGVPRASLCHFKHLQWHHPTHLHLRHQAGFLWRVGARAATCLQMALQLHSEAVLRQQMHCRRARRTRTAWQPRRPLRCCSATRRRRPRTCCRCCRPRCARRGSAARPTGLPLRRGRAARKGACHPAGAEIPEVASAHTRYRCCLSAEGSGLRAKAGGLSVSTGRSSWMPKAARSLAGADSWSERVCCMAWHLEGPKNVASV